MSEEVKSFEGLAKRFLNTSRNLKLAQYAAQYAQSVELAKAHSEMAYRLRKMRVALMKLERIAATQGGKAGERALKALPEARAAYETAMAAFEQEKPAVRAANQFLREWGAIKEGAGTIKGAMMARMATKANNLRKAFNGTRMGRTLLQTGKIVIHPAFQKATLVVGVALAGVIAYIDSPAQTQTGKVSNAALGAGTGAMTMMHPGVLVVDLFAPQGYKPSEHFQGTAAAVTVVGEGVLTGNTKAMDLFHEKSKRGDYGKLMQASSEAGEYWAEKGVSQGLKEFAKEFWDWL